MTRHHMAALLALAALPLGCTAPEPREPPPPDRLTLQEEVNLGRVVAPAVVEALGGELDDLAVQAYVRTIGQRVARATHLTHLPYRFTVLDAAEPRGVALPGGVVGVTRGLLRRLESEAQLAAALARQVAHLAAGHVRRGLTDRFPLADLRHAAAAHDAPGGGEAAAVRPIAGALLEPPYPDADRREADRLGLDYLAAAGYNPNQMAACLERIGADAERIDAIRTLAARKYADRRGRIADDVYSREVLERLDEP
ncbi:MAG: M48 family metalloprotease [Phycisphaerae bacterium]